MASLLPASSPPPLSTSSSSSSLSDKFDAALQLSRNGLGGALKRWLGLGMLLLVTMVLGLGLRKHGQGLTEDHTTFFEVPAVTLSRIPIYPARLDHHTAPIGQREIDISSQPLPLNTSTHDRLIAWANSPGGRGAIEGELEAGDMYSVNMESCANVWPSHSSEVIKNSMPLWQSFNRTGIHDHRMRLIEHLDTLDEQGVTQNYGEGRGIVTIAGNADTLERVLYMLRMMRHVYKSDLPVQIYHFPSERPPSDSKLVAEARELGAELVEAEGTKKDEKRRKNYHLKAIAIVQCPWREVIYLDSDNIPTTDPTYMFDAPPYKRLRAMFWPDYWKTAAVNPIWSILGVRCRDEWEQEAGSIIIDKKYHLDAMLLSQMMLENWKLWFNFSDGDKDIFRFAFLALRKRWAVPGRYVGVGALPRGTASGQFCGLTMMQYDHLGEPLFVHYNLLKQVSSGVYRGFSFGRTKQFPLFIAPHGQEERNKSGLIASMKAKAQDADEPGYEDQFDKVRGFGDVDCDMLCDADDFGRSRAPATMEVRRRAATERGARPFFHGGFTSALCVDARYDDPRPDSARAADKLAHETEQARLETMWAAAGLKQGDEGWGKPENHGGENPLGIKWDEPNFEIVQWKDDERLKDFENKLYDEGFVPSGNGF